MGNGGGWVGRHGSAGRGREWADPAALIRGRRKAGLGAGEGWSWKALGRREVLPSCWRGVSCFPPGARVKLMSESLARTDRRHPPRAHTLAWGTEPQPPAQLSSAAGGLLQASKLPGSPATSGRHLCPARSWRRRRPERARSEGTARGPRGSVRDIPGAGL